ncbi:hypothetical protein JCM15548_12107 [Geofilum rubicundum JCM 15548]|uniref:Gliding motility protein GldL-like N-terminal domain-containing protein n=2 Tax=Geofilum TaxID=1236988 RepID=A0A0E9LXN4_9BACT|nr:hypothetical protein JCM15548_12107 [Geofilum rubicundum JCM 15548]
MGKVYGIGAAVVILGALWKILHLPGASAMLIAGLGTEAIIFFLSAFEPPHEMPDWSLVYPELVGLEPRDRGHGGGGGGGSELAALFKVAIWMFQPLRNWEKASRNYHKRPITCLT